MKKILHHFTALLCLMLALATTAHADDTLLDDKLLTSSVTSGFDQVLEHAQSTLVRHGFMVAHIQKCDGGLHDMGYETDSYKVIFFGRLDEVRTLAKTYPQLVPLFPFKIAIYAEGEKIKLTIVNPATLSSALRADETLTKLLVKWEEEFKAFLKDIEKLPDTRTLASK